MNAELPLIGQVALVTGGGAGIGAACVARLAADGADGVVLDLEADAAERAAEVARAAGRVGVAVSGDAAVEADVDALFDVVDRCFGGRVDVLVHGAGGFTVAPPLQQLTHAEWDATLALNLTIAFLCSARAVSLMRAASYGRIVLIASMAARTGLADISIGYSAAKAGVVGPTRRLALDVAADGITVNAVAPGVVLSPRVARLRAGRLDAIRAATPVGRTGEPEEIAHAVAYLASPLAGFTTRVVLDVNGGRWMG